MKKGIITLLMLLVMSGCWLVDYKDVSNDKEYKELINQEYTTLKDLVIHGVTMDPNYKKQIDLYVLQIPPGFSGPEVISREILPKGTKLKIAKILKCTNCLSKRIKASIKILENEKYNTVPVHINYEGLRSTHNKALQPTQKPRG